MEILIGLFVGIIILGASVAIYDWVRLGMPIGKRTSRKRKTSKQASNEFDTSKADDQK